VLSISENGNVRVGHGFEGGETASDDEGGEGESEVLLVVGSRPEGEGTTAVEGQSEVDTLLVTEFGGEDGGDRREDDVGTEVSDLAVSERRKKPSVKVTKCAGKREGFAHIMVDWRCEIWKVV